MAKISSQLRRLPESAPMPLTIRPAVSRRVPGEAELLIFKIFRGGKFHNLIESLQQCIDAGVHKAVEKAKGKCTQVPVISFGISGKAPITDESKTVPFIGPTVTFHF